MTDQYSEERPLIEATQSIEKDELQVHYAGFWIRFCAYLFDLLIISCFQSIFINPFVSRETLEITSWLNGQVILHAIIFYAYFVLMTKFLRQTLGKMIFGLKVEADHGVELSWKDVLFREWIGRYISVSLLIPFVLSAFLPRKRALHDVFADTVVIHEGMYRMTKKAPTLA